MRRFSISILLCGLILSGTGCKKDAACAFSFFISNSYTQTDVNGAVIGTPNPSDWTNDQKWSACENSLFDFADDYNYQGLTATTVNNVIAFPNPFQGTFIFSSQYAGSSVVKTVLVDGNFNILSRNVVRDGMVMQFNPTGLSSKKHYRLYYRFYGNNQTVIYQGHGDLRTTE
jgi:hypothetical protein